MSLAGELIRRITPEASMHFSCRDQKCSEFNCGHYGLCDPPVKSYILPIHRNGRGQTGKFRSPNIFWPALEGFVLPLNLQHISENEACRRICRRMPFY